jgi:ElaB/YqjD/DUF883 family membrane-anchored ribosome-binding protein
MESASYGNTVNSTTGLSTGSGESALNKATSSAHSAVDSFANAADEATRKVKPKIDKVAAMAHDVVDKAAGAAADTADKLTARSESLSAAQKKLVSDTCSYVSANPLKSVGIAALAGFILARIIL